MAAVRSRTSRSKGTCADGQSSGPRLQVHDVTLGLHPHVPHVVFCQQQKPLSGDVVFLEQIGVQLHAARHKLR